jgi:hypothetical protein
VYPVLLIFDADELEDIAVRDQIQFSLDGEWPRVVFRIFHGHFQVHVPEIAAARSLANTHRFAIDPGRGSS